MPAGWMMLMMLTTAGRPAGRWDDDDDDGWPAGRLVGPMAIWQAVAARSHKRTMKKERAIAARSDNRMAGHCGQTAWLEPRSGQQSYMKTLEIIKLEISEEEPSTILLLESPTL